jgi:hypothetical protein
MALQFNEGAYGQAFQQGQQNEQADRDRLLELLNQGVGGGLQAYAQGQQQKQSSEQAQKLYELQLAKAQRDNQQDSDLDTPYSQLLSSGQLSRPVAPQSLLDSLQTPGMGEAGIPRGQQPGMQRGGLMERFRQFQQGKLSAPQMAPQEDITSKLQAFGLPPEAASMTPRQVKMTGEARKLFSDAGVGDSYSAEQARGILSGDLSSFGERVPNKAVQQASQVQRSRDTLDFRQDQSEMKQAKVEEKETALQQGQLQKAQNVIDKVDQALQKVGSFTTGLGAKLSVIPGTSAKDLEADIQTIKANLGFNELQEMRRNSPTGGALGQVAVQELQALQATVASLDQAQSPEQLRERLGEIKTRYINWSNTLRGQLPQNQNQGQPAGGWDQSKEQRYQELLRKRGGR